VFNIWKRIAETAIVLWAFNISAAARLSRDSILSPDGSAPNSAKLVRSGSSSAAPLGAAALQVRYQVDIRNRPIARAGKIFTVMAALSIDAPPRAWKYRVGARTSRHPRMTEQAMKR
jgi:hypothetical protein